MTWASLVMVLVKGRRRGVTVSDCPAWCEVVSHPDLFSDEAHEMRLAGSDETYVLLVQDERNGERELWLTVECADGIKVTSGDGLRALAAMLSAAADRLAGLGIDG